MTTLTVLDRDTVDETELDLYAENTAELYPQFQAIIANIKRKIARGTYNPALAPKLWRYWYDAAAKGYTREYGTGHGYTFSTATRQACANQRAIDAYEAILRGEYD